MRTKAKPVTVANVVRWLNEWGDLYVAHKGRQGEWREGYQQAIRETYAHLDRLLPDWPDEALAEEQDPTHGA